MKLGGNHATTCLWMSAGRESNKTSFEQRRVCELPTSHMVVSEIQHIEGDIVQRVSSAPSRRSNIAHSTASTRHRRWWFVPLSSRHWQLFIVPRPPGLTGIGAVELALAPRDRGRSRRGTAACAGSGEVRPATSPAAERWRRCQKLFEGGARWLG